MSRKTHPTGFRLGLTQPWIVNVPAYGTFKELLQQYILYTWLMNFAQQNSFYFLRFNYYATKFYHDFLLLVVFFPFRRRPPFRKLNYVSFEHDFFLFRKRRSKKKKQSIFIPKTDFTMKLAAVLPFTGLDADRFLVGPQRYIINQVKNELSGSFRNLFIKRQTFFRRFWASVYLNWHRLQWKRRRTKMQRINHVFSNFSFLTITSYKKPRILFRRRRFPFRRRRLSGFRRHLQKNQYKKLVRKGIIRKGVRRKRRFRKKFLVKRKYLRFLLYRFFCLRLRFFLERYLRAIHSRPLTLMLYNFTDIFRFGIFAKLPLNRKLGLRLLTAGVFLTHRLFEYRKYNFLSVLVGLVVTSSLVRTPHALLQWIWAYSIRVKKHSRYLTHRQLFNIVYRTIENTILMVGTFQGARIEIAGKLNDSTRTRRQITLFGKTFQRQTVFTSFVYGIKHIPTYLGVLGFRLWYIY